MIKRVRIFADYSSEFLFEDEISLNLTRDLSKVHYSRPKKIVYLNKTWKKVEESEVSMLPSKSVQSVDCMSSSILTYFQVAIAFLNLHLPNHSFVILKSLLDREVKFNSRKFTLDYFEIDPKYFVVEGEIIEFGSKNGLSAISLHEDGIHVQFKYLSLVYDDEKIQKDKYLYTWEIKFYTIYQLKAIGYLSLQVQVLKKIQLEISNLEGKFDKNNFIYSLDEFKKSERIEFPPNLCFMENKKMEKSVGGIVEQWESDKKKDLFLEYEKSGDLMFKYYKQQDNDRIIFGELNFGDEKVSLVYSNQWKSVIYGEEINGMWELRKYPQSVLHMVHVDVQSKCLKLFNFLESMKKVKKLLRHDIFIPSKKNRRVCEFRNKFAEFKCFESGTIHIHYFDGTFMEEKKGKFHLLFIGGKSIVTNDLDDIPKIYSLQYLKWKKFVEMDKKEIILEEKKNERILKLLEESRKRVISTQKIINKNTIDLAINYEIHQRKV